MSDLHNQSYRRSHRTHLEPDVRFTSRFGELGIWISYRDWMFVMGVGEPAFRWGGGRLRVGSSRVNFFADVVPAEEGGYRIAGIHGDRFLKARHSWAEHSSDRMTRKQLAYVRPILEAEINAAMADVTPEQIEACHRRGIEADIRSVKSSLEFQLRELAEVVGKAQDHFETVRALERSIGAAATPVPAHLAPAEVDLDAVMGEIEALAGARVPALAGAVGSSREGVRHDG